MAMGGSHALKQKAQGSDAEGSDRMATTRAFYEKQATEYARLTLPLSMERWLLPFAAKLPAGSEVIDLGCGPGRDLRFLCSMGFRAVGLDRSEPLVVIARRHANAPVVVGDFCSLPFASGSLGGAWAAASFLHLPRSEIVIALSEAHRVLATRSILFVSLKRGLGEMRDATGRSFTLVEPAELRGALKAAGFDIFDMEVERRESMEADSWDGQWISCLAGRR